MTATTIDFTASPASGAAPLSVAFKDASTGSPTGWKWDFGDGTTSTAQNPTHSYATNGTYTVKLTVASTNTKTNLITVGSTPTPTPTPSPTILILSEDFTDLAGLPGRGWYDGVSTSSHTGYYQEYDSVLGKNVIYSRHDNSDGNGGSSLRHSLPDSTEVTVWVSVKYHNLIATPSNCHHFYLGQGYGTYTPPAGTLTLYLEPKRKNGDEQNALTSAWESPSQTFGFDFYNPSDQERSAYNLSFNGILKDDQWYEIRYYVKTGTSGHVRIDYKVHAGVWTTVYDHDLNLASRPPINQFLVGSYVHNGMTTDQRFYESNLRIYKGNAIANIP